MEQQLLFMVNRQWTGPALDLFMAAMSSFDVWVWPLGLFVLLLVVRGGFTGRAFALTAGLLVAFTDGVVARNLKILVQRPRPHEVLADVRRVDLRRATPRLLALFKKPRVRLSRPASGPPGRKSFPSGHTANMFCLAATASAFYGRRGALLFLVALIVGYSRVYTGSHWPSDVLASAPLGVSVAMLGLAAFELLWRKFAPRLSPAIAEAHPSLFGKLPG